MDYDNKHFYRFISCIILFFFCWSFAGGVDIAFAVKNSDKLIGTDKSKKNKKSEEQFNTTLDDIKAIFENTAIDTDTKKIKLKTKKTEIDAFDIEVRKQFKQTEDRIKGLPEVIKQRHKDFIKHYEDNLNELKTNLDAIDKAKTKTEVDTAIEKANKHLQKVKPPKKYRPLDPNKLPHRTVKRKEVAVEEWVPPKKPNPLERLKKTAEAFDFSSSELQGIQVASNGSLQGLLSSDTVDKLGAQDFIQLAQTPVPPYPKNVLPTEADLAETIEVKFTPEIQAKAQELGNNPHKIYEWVRNNIEYVPTYGSIQGANYCLQTKLCNDMDIASLLIALLRVSGVHAQYVYGTKEMPIEKFMNWAGGFTDKMAALNLFASAGVPTKGLTAGGQIKYAQFEHVWVKAYVDYIPSRGSRHKTGKGDTWIYLDASLKLYNYTDGINIQSAVPFDAQSLIDQITSTATINEQEGYATGVDSAYIQQTMTDYQTQVKNYITQIYPDATVGDILGKKEIIKHEWGFLPVLPMFRTVNINWIKSELPDNLRHKINFNVTKDIFDQELGTPINITKSLPELAGKKITLSYSPATQADENTIASYFPTPHTDGTPINPSELPSSLPAYLINLKPELRIDGAVVATGSKITMGTTEQFKMTFSGPEPNANDVIINDVQAGEYLGIGLDLGKISEKHMEDDTVNYFV